MSDTVLEWVVKGTLLLLVAFSVATWAIVAIKATQAWRAQRKDRAFIAKLGSTKGLPLASHITKDEGPAARLTQAGLRALEEAEDLQPHNRRDDGTAGSAQGEYLERSLHEQLQREKRITEAGLAVLASIGTTAPFVGLFGTVWGIIHALKRIGASGSASLDVVAGPIGEALVATGVGIAVAVPAVLAYNIFVRKLKVQQADLEQQASSLVKLALRTGASRRIREQDLPRVAREAV